MDALQMAELRADDDACSHALEGWRSRLEGWAARFGVHLRGAEHGQDCIEIAHDPAGPVRILSCGACGYVGVEESARWQRPAGIRELPAERTRVATPGAHTIELLASALQVDPARTIKAVFLTDERGSLTFVVLPGDLDVSLWKLARVVGSQDFRPASAEEIRAAGAEPGFASPIGLRVLGDDDPQGVRVVADSAILEGSNYAAGSNEEGYHFTGVNFPRDFRATLVGDVALAPEGAACSRCGHRLELERGLPVAAWRVLGTPIIFGDERGGQGQARLTLGTVFLDAILMAVIQEVADSEGIAWPVDLAPYAVHLVDLKSTAASLAVEALLAGAGLETLFDDRDVSSGVKFTDADLIGCPVRITVGARSQARGGVEVSGRRGADPKVVPLSELLDEVGNRLGRNYVKRI